MVSSRIVQDVKNNIKTLQEKGFLSIGLPPDPESYTQRVLEAVIHFLEKGPQGPKPLEKSSATAISRKFGDDDVTFFIGFRLEHYRGRQYIEQVAVSINDSPFTFIKMPSYENIYTAEETYKEAKRRILGLDNGPDQESQGRGRGR